jgi:hypothetical protein
LKPLVLAAVLGATLALGGLHSVSAKGNGGGISTTVGDESNPLVDAYGPQTNAVNHVCPDGRTLTTGYIAKDSPLLGLCNFTWTGFSGMNGPQPEGLPGFLDSSRVERQLPPPPELTAE